MAKSTPVTTENQIEVPVTAPVKTKKSKKTTVSDEAVESQTSVAETAPVDEVVAPAKTSGKKKSKQVVADVPSDAIENVIITPPSEESVVVEVVEETGETAVSDLFNQFTVKLSSIHSSLGTLKNELKVLEKKYNKDLKTLQKKSSKKKRNPNRAPSGFVKPALISEELAAFLNKPYGTEMARTSVTKEINMYIKEKSLADKENGRHIIPDQALSTLLNLSPTDELTYFNLQKYMRHHFAKAEPAAAVAAAAPGVTV